MELAVDDLVLVESTNRVAQVGGKVAKLQARYDGPYKVLEVVNGGRDVRLHLPLGDKRHDLFHILKLKKYRTDLPPDSC